MLVGLSKTTPDSAAHWNGYSKYLIPSYEISSDDTANKFIDDVVGKMKMMPGYENLSIGALYQLSVRSTAHLTVGDLERYIFNVFAGEMVDEVAAQRLARDHIAVLRSNNVLRYPDS